MRTGAVLSSFVRVCYFSSVRILFVCVTNICRSPYAEYLFGRMVSEDAVLSRRIEWVKSGGVSFMLPRISKKAKFHLVREGFSPEAIDRHRPRMWLFAFNRFAEADLIIGMTKLQGWLLPWWWRGKYVTLSEAATGSYTPIPDPALMGPREYDAAMRVIKEYLQKLKDRLRAGEEGPWGGSTRDLQRGIHARSAHQAVAPLPCYSTLPIA
jgi:protein-tyrosine-phosphatase